MSKKMEFIFRLIVRLTNRVIDNNRRVLIIISDSLLKLLCCIKSWVRPILARKCNHILCVLAYLRFFSAKNFILSNIFQFSSLLLCQNLVLEKHACFNRTRRSSAFKIYWVKSQSWIQRAWRFSWIHRFSNILKPHRCQARHILMVSISISQRSLIRMLVFFIGTLWI